MLAALCFVTIIGAPFGIFFLWQARKKEKEKEKLVEAATS